MHILVMIAALAAPAGERDGKTMAVDDWRSLAIYGVGRDVNGPLYLQAHAGDLDGDGRSDDAIMSLVCADGQLRSARYIVSPRDAATGQASGKRTHHPVTFVKEWGPATPKLRTMKTVYDVKKVEGARLSAGAGGWTDISLANADGLCQAAEEAARKATKTRSNIQNN